MKSNKIITAALLAVAVSSTHASTQPVETLIDFEDDVFKTTGKGVTTFSYENVTFSGIGRDLAPSEISFTDKSRISTPDFSNYFLRTNATNFETLKFSFATAVSDFSFNFGGNGHDWRLDAFDESGAKLDSLLIEKLPSIGDNNGGQFFGLSSSLANISYATLTDLEEGAFGGVIEDMVTVDNFKYVTSPIPEPSTYALMIGGLGMVGFMAYRRRQKEQKLN